MLNGKGAVFYLKLIIEWNSDKSKSEIRRKKQKEKRHDALYTHAMVWTKKSL